MLSKTHIQWIEGKFLSARQLNQMVKFRFWMVKAALFIYEHNQMIICNVKDEPIDNYAQTLHFPSALQSVLASFSSFL